MAHSNNKDPKLSEVKAVLQRLQGFETEPEPATNKSAGTDRQSGRGAVVAAWFVILATTVGLLGAVYLFVLTTGPGPDPPRTAEEAPARTVSVPPSPPQAQEPAAAPQRPDPAAPDVRAALEGARALMAKGKVRAAREQLLTLANKGSPDAAWDLARSYDPNVLVGL